ncbi:MAG: hypothetical protein R3E77_10290 [Steroidobacteraceae bacterium]
MQTTSTADFESQAVTLAGTFSAMTANAFSATSWAFVAWLAARFVRALHAQGTLNFDAISAVAWDGWCVVGVTVVAALLSPFLVVCGVKVCGNHLCVNRWGYQKAIPLIDIQATEFIRRSEAENTPIARIVFSRPNGRLARVLLVPKNDKLFDKFEEWLLTKPRLPQGGSDT